MLFALNAEHAGHKIGLEPIFPVTGCADDALSVSSELSVRPHEQPILTEIVSEVSLGPVLCAIACGF